jgi:hypothetical protein
MEFLPGRLSTVYFKYSTQRKFLLRTFAESCSNLIWAWVPGLRIPDCKSEQVQFWPVRLGSSAGMPGVTQHFFTFDRTEEATHGSEKILLIHSHHTSFIG